MYYYVCKESGIRGLYYVSAYQNETDRRNLVWNELYLNKENGIQQWIRIGEPKYQTQFFKTPREAIQVLRKYEKNIVDHAEIEDMGCVRSFKDR